MTLNELELRLSELRKDMGVTYKWLSEHGLPMATVNKINNGGNYKMGSLFKYATNLYYAIRVDGEAVFDNITFGQLLRKKRISLGYNGVQLQSKLVWSPAKLIKIEKGQEYFKTALLEYLKVIPVDFDLVNASELSDEEQEKYLNY